MCYGFRTHAARCFNLERAGTHLHPHFHPHDRRARRALRPRSKSGVGAYATASGMAAPESGDRDNAQCRRAITIVAPPRSMAGTIKLLGHTL